MALALGTNCGFVETAPVDDPAGAGNHTMDGYARAIKDTSSATAAKITEVGWWCDNATEEANFEVGLYDDDSGSAGDLIHVERTHAKGTSSGWKKATGLNWVISSDTIYWIAVQLDNTATTTQENYGSHAGGPYYDYLTGVSTLPDTFSGITGSANYIISIYAVWEAAAGGLSIPVAMYHYMHH